jgi:hypothetical protein
MRLLGGGLLGGRVKPSEGFDELLLGRILF